MSFDPTTFLDQTVTGASSTSSEPVPEGEYQAILEKLDVKPWASRDGATAGLKLELVWDILDEAVKATLGRTKVTSRQSIMLDLTESGAMDMGKGKNVGVGRLREATNMNDPKKPFSFGMLVGQMAKVGVKHRVYEGNIFDEVKAVARI